MSGNKRDAAKAALKNVPMLHEDFVEPALRMLEAAGVLDSERSGNGGQVHAAAASDHCLTPLQVVQANADNGIRLKRVCAEAARLGYQIKPAEKINMFELDSALAGKDVEARMRLKRNLAYLGMIP